MHTPISFVVVNIYACKGQVDIHTWLRLFDHEENNIVFRGHFNARVRQWGSVHTTQQGEDLENALLSSDLICINDAVARFP